MGWKSYQWNFSLIMYLPKHLRHLSIRECEINVWLILILMITKQDLELMIIFQVWLGKTISRVTITKTNQAKKKSWKRRPPKRRVFQDQSFIRSLCKVVGALRLLCISFFIYAPKSSNSNIILNILRIWWFHVFN